MLGNMHRDLAMALVGKDTQGPKAVKSYDKASELGGCT